MQAGSETERQPLVVHSNPASGRVLCAKGVEAKMVLAAPAGVCQDELPAWSLAWEHIAIALRSSLKEVCLFVSGKGFASRQSLQRNAETVLISLPSLRFSKSESLSGLKL